MPFLWNGIAPIAFIRIFIHFCFKNFLLYRRVAWKRATRQQSLVKINFLYYENFLLFYQVSTRFHTLSENVLIPRAERFVWIYCPKFIKPIYQF